MSNHNILIFSSLCSNVVIVVVPCLQDNKGRPIVPDRRPDTYSIEELTPSDRRRRDVYDESRDRRAATPAPPYITAKLRGDHMPSSFTIGDGAVYDGYYNKELEKGTYYAFFTRVTVMSEDEVRGQRS